MPVRSGSSCARRTVGRGRGRGGGAATGVRSGSTLPTAARNRAASSSSSCMHAGYRSHACARRRAEPGVLPVSCGAFSRKPMRVLVSNDDGVDAPGIHALAQGLRDAGHEVYVVAPDRDRSGASNSLTLDLPIRVKRLDHYTCSVAGTPTDCVHLALTGMFEFEPDIVVSGI